MATNSKLAVSDTVRISHEVLFFFKKISKHACSTFNHFLELMFLCFILINEQTQKNKKATALIKSALKKAHTTWYWKWKWKETKMRNENIYSIIDLLFL